MKLGLFSSVKNKNVWQLAFRKELAQLNMRPYINMLLRFCDGSLLMCEMPVIVGLAESGHAFDGIPWLKLSHSSAESCSTPNFISVDLLVPEKLLFELHPIDGHGGPWAALWEPWVCWVVTVRQWCSEWQCCGCLLLRVWRPPAERGSAILRAQQTVSSWTEYESWTSAGWKHWMTWARRSGDSVRREETLNPKIKLSSWLFWTAVSL